MEGQKRVYTKNKFAIVRRITGEHSRQKAIKDYNETITNLKRERLVCNDRGVKIKEKEYQALKSLAESELGNKLLVAFKFTN